MILSLIDMRLIDIHTHSLPDAPGTAVYCLPQGVTGIQDNQLYSAGIHPWNTADDVSTQLEWLERIAQDRQVAAIGESGVDRLRGAGTDAQIELFVRQALLADRLQKPLIIHSVRSSDIMLKIRRELCPSVPWAIHGFRGGVPQARQLLDSGFMLSFGIRFNPDTLRFAGLERALFETDNHSNIHDVIANAAKVLNVVPDVVADSAAKNARSFLEPLLAR